MKLRRAPNGQLLHHSRTGVTLKRQENPQVESTIAVLGLAGATNVPRSPLTTHALLLRNIGVALYGPAWRPEMARRRNVSSFVIRRWETGVQTIPERVWVELRDELRAHRLLLDDLLEQLPT
jgi:hypothetical protein